MPTTLTSTKTRHKKIIEAFHHFYEKTNSVDEAARAAAEELGYTISYVNKIRYRYNKNEKSIS